MDKKKTVDTSKDVAPSEGVAPLQGFAATALDKDQVHQLLQQLIEFGRMGGWFYPRILLACDIASSILVSQWDKIWELITGQPAALALLKTMRTMDLASKGLTPSVLANGISVVYRDKGHSFPTWMQELHAICTQTVTAKAHSDAYYQTRQGIAGALMMLQGFALVTRSETDDNYVRLLYTIFVQHFDEVWAVQHPNEK